MGYGTPSRIGNLSAAGTINTVYGMGRVTHLLFGQSAAPLDADKLSVVLRSPDDPEEVIVNNISLLALAGISDLEGGASSSLQSAVSGVTTTDFVGFFFAVDVGNLDLRATGSDLAISVVSTTAITMFVSAVAWKPDGPDYVLRTIEQAVLQVSAQDVEAVYCYVAAGTDTPFSDTELNDVNITVDSEVEGSSNCTLQDCFAMSAALGECESNAPRNVILLYRNLDDVPDNVKVQISGSDADSTLRLIVQSRRYVTNRLLRGSVGQLERLERKVGKYGAEKQIALNMNGITAPAATLKQNLDTVRRNRNTLLKARGR
jgi:hypothetical protein